MTRQAAEEFIDRVEFSSLHLGSTFLDLSQLPASWSVHGNASRAVHVHP